MRKQSKLIIAIVAILIILCIAFLIIANRKPPEQSFITTVSVKSGTVEVQTEGGSEVLKAGEKSIVESGKRPVKIKKQYEPKIVEEKPVRQALPTGMIGGRVLTRNDLPIENAAVIAQWYKKPGGNFSSSIKGKPGKVTSDSEGEFLLTGLKEKGFYDLKVRAEGYVETVGEDIPIGAKGVIIKLLPESTISGTVYHENTSEPLEGVNATLVKSEGERKSKPIETISDTDGCYHFRGLLGSKSYSLMAVGKGLISDILYVQLEQKENKSGVDLYMYSIYPITGRTVFKETQEPVSGVDLEIRRKYPERRFRSKEETEETVAQTTSDIDGDFTFPLVPRGYYKVVTTRMNSYQCDTTILISLVKAELPEPLIIEIFSLKRVYGVVTDSEGKPIAGTRVYIRRVQGSTRGGVPELKDHFTTSRSDGTYEITGLTAEMHEFVLCFDHDRYAAYEKTVVFGNGEVEKQIDAVLGKGLCISGIVTDSDFQPIEDVAVSMNYLEATLGQYTVSKTASTDVEGSFTVKGITTGTWQPTLMKKSYVSYHPSSITVSDTGVTGVQFFMGKGCEIAGRVFAGDNTPLIDQELRFSIDTAGYHAFRKVTTDLDGTFVISDLKEGVYHGEVSFELGRGTSNANQYRIKLNNIPAPSDDLVIQAGNFGAISGYVRVTGSDDLVSDFTITAWGVGSSVYCEGSFSSKGSGLEDGLFHIANLTAGTYHLGVLAEGYYYKRIDDTIKLEEGELIEGIEIELIRGGEYIITGRVVSKSSALPVDKAEVYLIRKDRKSPVSFAFVLTEEDGIFEFNSVGPGEFALEVKHPDFAEKTVDIVATEDTYIVDIGDIALGTGAIIEGIVTYRGGMGITNAALIINQKAFQISVRTDENGYYKMVGIPPGKMNIQCFVPNHTQKRLKCVGTKSVIVVEDESMRVDFVIEQGVKIWGQLMNNNEPIQETRILLYLLDEQDMDVIQGATKKVETDENGNFIFEDVKPGKRMLMIRKFAGKTIPQYQHKEVVIVGSEELNINVFTRNPIVRGYLVDEAGSPIKKSMRFNLVPLDLEKHNPNTARWFAFIAYSDEEGRFNAGRIDPGLYRILLVKRPGNKIDTTQKVMVEERVDISDLVLTLPKE